MIAYYALDMNTTEPVIITGNICADCGNQLTDYQIHAPVADGQALPCGCPAVGGHFDGCPRLAEASAQR